MNPSTLEAMQYAWESNQRVNIFMLDHLTDLAMLKAVTPGGGFTVEQHLGHMIEVLASWTHQLDPAATTDVPDLFDLKTRTFVTEPSLERIRQIWNQMSAATWDAASKATSTGQLSHVSVPQFLVHMMIHDAHHRGQVLIALKVAGFPLPNEDEMWDPLNDEIRAWNLKNAQP